MCYYGLNNIITHSMMDYIDILNQRPLVFISMISAFGLVVGSFLNVVIYRLPIIWDNECKSEASEYLGLDAPERTDISLSFPRSFCPNCNTKLSVLDNVPVLSYLFLKGKCRYCSQKISLRYPSIELLSGVLSGYIAFLYGPVMVVPILLVCLWVLICIAMIDYDTQIIPDSLSLPLMWLALLSNATIMETVTLYDSVLGAAAGYMILWSINGAYKIIRGCEGVGGGDFKLLAFIGALCGYQAIASTLFSAAIIGLLMALIAAIAGKFERQVPFGPSLILAGTLNFAHIYHDLPWVSIAGTEIL